MIRNNKQINDSRFYSLKCFHNHILCVGNNDEYLYTENVILSNYIRNLPNQYGLKARDKNDNVVIAFEMYGNHADITKRVMNIFHGYPEIEIIDVYDKVKIHRDDKMYERAKLHEGYLYDDVCFTYTKDMIKER